MSWWALLLLTVWIRLLEAIDPPRLPHQPLGNGTQLLGFNETVISKSLVSTTLSWAWEPNGDDGDFISSGSLPTQELVLTSVVSPTRKVLVKPEQFPKQWSQYWLNQNMSKVLWACNEVPISQYAFNANYFVQSIPGGQLEPLVDDQNQDIQYAEFNPAQEGVAFVRNNNLFYKTNGTIHQLTSDGDNQTFNGVPNWLYGREILGPSRSAFVFSPDGTRMAFLKINEAQVPVYTIPHYFPDPNNQVLAQPYPQEVKYRYPKAGQPNPQVTFHLVDLSELKPQLILLNAFPIDDMIIGEFTWMTNNSSCLIVKAFNRAQDHVKFVRVDAESKVVKTVREQNDPKGWYDNTKSMRYLGALRGNRTQGMEWYLDLSDKSGWTHIYLFPVKGGDPIALTQGAWEVMEIIFVNTDKKLVYYTSTQHHSTERHFYSVSYTTFEAPKPMVDDTVPAVWDASFSSGGGFYVLSYLGPDVPYQELYSIEAEQPLRTVNNNTNLLGLLGMYKLPRTEYSELKHPDGHTMNAAIRYPPNFDKTKKYPLLFTPYGGPGSQTVIKLFLTPDFNAYVSSDPELEYVTVTVDNRGTAGKGRAFRTQVTGQLGKLEAEDQVWAAKEISKQPWVDKDKIAIWGLSFGGYLAGKCMETDTGVFSLAMMTAPVQDWRLYDSIYAERYMKSPGANDKGYNESSIRKADGFLEARGGFLIQHGTADDQVHFQHSAALTNIMMSHEVGPDKMQTQWFTDSSHYINFSGGGLFLYRQLAQRLYEEKQRSPNVTQYAHEWTMPPPHMVDGTPDEPAVEPPPGSSEEEE